MRITAPTAPIDPGCSEFFPFGAVGAVILLKESPLLCV